MTSGEDPQPGRGDRRALRAVRIWLPAIIILAGVVIVIVDPTETGLEGAAAMVGAGLSVWLLNLLYRMGVSGDAERAEEEAARAYFEEHGRWPDPPSRSSSPE